MHLTYAGIITPKLIFRNKPILIVAPYLCRDYYSVRRRKSQRKPRLHLTYAGIITLLEKCILKLKTNVAPYLCRDYYSTWLQRWPCGRCQLHLTYAGIITRINEESFSIYREGCTLPMQGLLLATYCGWLYCRSGCTLPMQGLLLAIMLIRPNKSMLHLTYAGIITPSWYCAAGM